MTSSRDAKGIMGAARHTLALFALIIVVVEVIFSVVVLQLSGNAQLLTVGGMIAIVILLIVIAGIRWVNPTNEGPIEIKKIWTEKDIPLDPEYKECLMGRWHCEWFNYNEETKKQESYSDDIIDINAVDLTTGHVHGKGLSAYGPTVDFTIEGRASKRGLLFLLYTSPAPYQSIFGNVVLFVRPPGVLRGWWLGTGFDNEIVGGETVWTHEAYDKRKDFERVSHHGREKKYLQKPYKP